MQAVASGRIKNPSLSKSKAKEFLASTDKSYKELPEDVNEKNRFKNIKRMMRNGSTNSRV